MPLRTKKNQLGAAAVADHHNRNADQERGGKRQEQRVQRQADIGRDRSKWQAAQGIVSTRPDRMRPAQPEAARVGLRYHSGMAIRIQRPPGCGAQ